MERPLCIGKFSDEGDLKAFYLPHDAVTRTFAVMGVRGSGKTTTATVLAEEFCEAGLPFVVFDPVGVWYGLRRGVGGHKGYPVVIVGGLHGDLPLERDAGATYADAIIDRGISAVIDFSQESKRFWRQFLTDFCIRLMQKNPAKPTHVFVEEAPEFCPQRSRADLTAQTSEAVERLVRLGRNRGYGATLVTQRPATVAKDVLSQCENLFVLRTTGAHDRKALTEWLEGQRGEKAAELLRDLPALPSGEAYFWSPEWLHTFVRVKVRERETMHPGATRTVAAGTAAPGWLSNKDVDAEVDALKAVMARFRRAEVAPKKPAPAEQRQPAGPDFESMLRKAQDEAKSAVTVAEARAEAAERRATSLGQKLATARRALEPQFRALQALFADEAEAPVNGVAHAAYEPWLEKAGAGLRRRLLEALMSRGPLSRQQLATWSKAAVAGGGFRNALSWMRVNGLIQEQDDGRIALREV